MRNHWFFVLAFAATLAVAQPPPIVLSPINGGGCFGGYPPGDDQNGDGKTFTIFQNDSNTIVLTERQIWPATFPVTSPTAPFACYAYGTDARVAWLERLADTESILIFTRPLWGRQEEAHILFKPYHQIGLAGVSAVFLTTHHIFTDGLRLFISARVRFLSGPSAYKVGNVILQLAGKELKLVYEAGEFSLSQTTSATSCGESIYFTQTLGRQFYQLLQVSKGRMRVVETSVEPIRLSCEGEVGLVNNRPIWEE